MRKIFFLFWITILIFSCNRKIITIEEIKVPVISNYDFTHPVETSRLEIYNYPLYKMNDLTRLNLKGNVESRTGGTDDLLFNKDGYILNDGQKYLYDSLNRIIEIEHAIKEVKYTYNKNDQLINTYELYYGDSSNSYSKNISYLYDSKQRLTEKIYKDLNGKYLSNILFSYDNNTVKIAFMNSGERIKTIVNTYNKDGLLVKNHIDRGPADDRSTYFCFYDEKQQMTQEIQFTNNVYQSEWNFEYDSLRNQTRSVYMNRKTGYKEEYIQQYTYDKKGNIVSEKNFFNGKPTRVDCFTYTYFE